MQEITHWVKFHKARAILLVILGVAIVASLIKTGQHAATCSSRKETVIVQGSSMQGLVSGGVAVTGQYNYYKCHPVLRNDIVIFAFAGNPNPLLKIVKGIPGDHWNLEATKEGTHILVNGLPLRNAQGLLYTLNDAKAKLLGLYVHDYKGVIPPHAYLLLGNLPNGSMDSTQFGLIEDKGILAKVVLRAGSSQ